MLVAQTGGTDPMKKTAAALVLLLSLAVLTACGGEKPGPAGTAEEIADRIFAQAKVEPFGPYQSLEDDEAREFYLGSKDYPAFADSVAALPMISIDTRVLVILRAADRSTVKQITDKLAQNIDPNRLVCVTFSPEDVVIESRGDVIFLSINSNAEQRKALTEAFKTIQ
jgi:hypothetical protein